MTNVLPIEGIGIANYRSFGEEMQYLRSLGHINFLVGKNNCGKSNILKFLQRHYTTAAKSQAISLSKLDLHQKQKQKLRLAVASSLLPHKLQESTNLNLPTACTLLKKILTFRENQFWISYTLAGIKLQNDLLSEKADIDYKTLSDLVRISSANTGKSSLRIDNIIPYLIEPIQRIPNQPKIETIPAFRKISNGKEDVSPQHSGAGLIERLNQLKNADHEHLEDKLQFKKIVSFLQDVTGEKNSNLEIPHHKKFIEVFVNDRQLPLESLGTGIHEVIVIAAAATILKNQVVCIEEPEIHLHPILQRKLIRYLEDHTDNQYFIATHSAHFLDHPGASIYHIRLEDGVSKIENASMPSDRSNICVDLGYRPSDLLQTNCIVWVEGPSDRIYLNHWLRGLDDELIEGVHYSIMFYGGRLLSHLSTEDEEQIEDFISLRQLNRFVAVLMDSDREQKGLPVNKTKRRIRTGLQKDGFAWITDGREVENYVDFEILNCAYQAVHSSEKPLEKPKDKYAKITDRKPFNKVKIARQVAESEAAYPPDLDLEKKIKDLIAFIKRANEL